MTARNFGAGSLALGIVAMLAATSGRVQAAMITETTSVSGINNTFGLDVFLPQFNPSLGTLTAVSASLSGQFTPTFTFLTQGTTSSNPVEFDPQIGLLEVSESSSAGSNFINLVQHLNPEFVVPPDVTGGTVTGLSQPFAIGGPLSLTGPSGFSLAGTGTLDFFIDGSSGVVPGNGRIAEGDDISLLSGQLAVTFTYAPAVSEPASLGLFAVGMMGLGGLRLRRRG